MLTTTNKTIELKTSSCSKTTQNTKNFTNPRIHRLWAQSSYDRGIQYALKMWPKIKEKYPDATFDICYGWSLFDKAYSNNPERMSWKNKVCELMTQEGITEHGKIGQGKMREIRSQCGIWFYPTDFEETNCIGALECQDEGVVPCTMDKAGLKDTVGSGIVTDGEIWDPEVREKYLKELLDLMGNEKRWLEEQEKGKKFVKQFYRDKIANKWMEEFK